MLDFIESVLQSREYNLWCTMSGSTDIYRNIKMSFYFSWSLRQKRNWLHVCHGWSYRANNFHVILKISKSESDGEETSERKDTNKFYNMGSSGGGVGDEPQYVVAKYDYIAQGNQVWYSITI